jgi:hypothetical protein
MSRKRAFPRVLHPLEELLLVHYVAAEIMKHICRVEIFSGKFYYVPSEIAENFMMGVILRFLFYFRMNYNKV